MIKYCIKNCYDSNYLIMVVELNKLSKMRFPLVKFVS